MEQHIPHSTPQGAPPLNGADLPRPPGTAIAQPHGTLHERKPLEFAAAIERSYLPSVAQEIAMKLRLQPAITMVDVKNEAVSVFENGRVETVPLHLLAEETSHPDRMSEIVWARSNKHLSNLISPKTHELLDHVARLAEDRELGLFNSKYIRGPLGPIPFGRLVVGLAAELFEKPLTPVGLHREESGVDVFRWYLAEEPPERQLHRLGSERDRLQFCQTVIGEGFQVGQYFLRRPLEAVIALGERLGLLSGQSDERTAYIAARNDLDATGEPLSLIVRPGSPNNWAPGLEVCWAHHDNLPRPTETRRPRDR